MMSTPDAQKQVEGWLDDVGMSYTEGGVTGPALAWAMSMAFGRTTHVSIACDIGHDRRSAVMSELSISDDHRSSHARMPKEARAALDRRIVQTILRHTDVSFHIVRDAHGAPETISMRAFVPIDSLRARDLLHLVCQTRNCTMDL